MSSLWVLVEWCWLSRSECQLPGATWRCVAAGDLAALASLIPARSRLVMDPGAAPGGGASTAAPQMAMVATASVRVGDVLRVLPGERLPVDGVILSGRCSVDESMLTGESALLSKSMGDPVRLPLIYPVSTCWNGLQL